MSRKLQLLLAVLALGLLLFACTGSAFATVYHYYQGAVPPTSMV